MIQILINVVQVAHKVHVLVDVWGHLQLLRLLIQIYACCLTIHCGIGLQLLSTGQKLGSV